MLHVGLSSLGWVLGGPTTVIESVLEAVGPDGTVAMPTFTAGNTNPANWQAPPVPAIWWQIIRDERPAFDPVTSPSRGMGKVSECFRTFSQAIRGTHPVASWTAIGPKAKLVIKHEGIACHYGSNSPCQKFYDLKGHVLSLGTDKTTILHYAEAKANFANKRFIDEGTAAILAGRRQWIRYKEQDWCDEDFEMIRADYIAAGHPNHRGPMAYGRASLYPIRDLVDYAIDWMETNRH